MASPASVAVHEALKAPPFLTIDGLFNFRDVGNHYAAGVGTEPSDTKPLFVKPSYLYRCAEPSHITPQGREQLKELGVKKVFDFRSELEIEKYKQGPMDVEGVEVVHCPVSEEEKYDPVSLAKRVQDFGSDSTQAFAKLYEGILEGGGPAFEAVLRHAKDHPDQPCVVHCTAGKDRTGVFSAVFLKLLGVSDEDIAKDYNLTEIGLEPLMPALIARFQKEPRFRDNWEATLKMASAKPETIMKTLSIVQEKYGSVENYLKARTSLTDEDLEAIKKGLLIES